MTALAGKALDRAAMWSIALTRARAATSAPIMRRNGFTCYATYDKYAIPLIVEHGPDLD